MLKDNYGRPVNNLRIAVTQKCNLACFFCHKEGEKQKSDIEMMPEEIQRIVSIAASFGVDKVKLTGGEPLIRADIVEIVKRIREVPKIKDLAITTNGIQLKESAFPLKTAGLDRVNVSLGSIRPQTYETITGVDSVKKVIQGLQEAAHAGLHPIKLNMVVLRGLNDDQIWEMVEFARASDYILQLIEVESPTTNDDYYKQYHRELVDIERELSQRAKRIIVREMHARRRFLLEEGGEVEVVRPMHNTEFCLNCTRLRLTSNGKLKPCLFVEEGSIDILHAVRLKLSDEQLRFLYSSAVALRKPYFT